MHRDIFMMLDFIKERRLNVRIHQSVVLVQRKDQLVNAQLMVWYTLERDITLITVLSQPRLISKKCIIGKQLWANQLEADKPAKSMLLVTHGKASPSNASANQRCTWNQFTLPTMAKVGRDWTSVNNLEYSDNIPVAETGNSIDCLFIMIEIIQYKNVIRCVLIMSIVTSSCVAVPLKSSATANSTNLAANGTVTLAWQCTNPQTTTQKEPTRDQTCVHLPAMSTTEEHMKPKPGRRSWPLMRWWNNHMRDHSFLILGVMDVLLGI